MKVNGSYPNDIKNHSNDEVTRKIHFKYELDKNHYQLLVVDN